MCVCCVATGIPPIRPSGRIARGWHPRREGRPASRLGSGRFGKIVAPQTARKPSLQGFFGGFPHAGSRAASRLGSGHCGQRVAPQTAGTPSLHAVPFGLDHLGKLAGRQEHALLQPGRQALQPGRQALGRLKQRQANLRSIEETHRSLPGPQIERFRIGHFEVRRQGEHFQVSVPRLSLEAGGPAGILAPTRLDRARRFLDQHTGFEGFERHEAIENLLE